MNRTHRPDPKEKINWLSSAPFFGFHAAAVAALLVGVDRAALLLCGALYFVRMFFITAGYHRYFSHLSLIHISEPTRRS